MTTPTTESIQVVLRRDADEETKRRFHTDNAITTRALLRDLEARIKALEAKLP